MGLGSDVSARSLFLLVRVEIQPPPLGPLATPLLTPRSIMELITGVSMLRMIVRRLLRDDRAYDMRCIPAHSVVFF